MGEVGTGLSACTYLSALTALPPPRSRRLHHVDHASEHAQLYPTDQVLLDLISPLCRHAAQLPLLLLLLLLLERSMERHVDRLE